MTYPPGARGRREDATTMDEPLERFSRWLPLRLTRVLPVDPDQGASNRSGDERRTSLVDALAGVWQGAFAMITVARPVSPVRVEAALRVAEATTRIPTQRGAEFESKAEMARRRYLELRDAQITGLWDVSTLVGVSPDPAEAAAPSDSPTEAKTAGAVAALAALVAASVDLTQTSYLLRPGTSQVTGSLESVVMASCSATSGPDTDLAVPSSVLGRVAAPPDREVPGLPSVTMTHFDVAVEGSGQVSIGEVLDAYLRPAGTLQVPLDSLNRHTLVCGATGSGKSQTVRHLLEMATRMNPPLPWLVLEPAKAEYARMAGRLVDLGAVGEVLRIRPGHPSAPAVGINPLEPSPAPSGTKATFPLQTHLDLVRALFLAAFDAQEPFPQVLSAALTRCYEEQGWDLVLGKPRPGLHGVRYPQLSDLQRAARAVVDEVGYGREVRDNMRGFIEVRLASLRLGTPGRFLEGGHPLDVEELMHRNVVVELEDVGDDQDKAFLMGVMLIRITESLRLRFGAAPEVPPLHHLLVIEEAHRLLRRVEGNGATDHAIEMFASLLAEVRAYGQGIVVAEQIPTKILSDVVKNTAVKILHRLPAQDDREIVGSTINLDEAQSRCVVALPTGRAVAFIDGMDAPVLIQVPSGGWRRESAEHCTDQAPCLTSVSTACAQRCLNGDDRCTLARQRESTQVEDYELLRLWAESETVRLLTGMPANQPIAQRFSRLAWSYNRDPIRHDCAIAQAAESAVRPRAADLVAQYSPDELVREVATSMRKQLRFERPSDDRNRFIGGYFAAVHQLRQLGAPRTQPAAGTTNSAGTRDLTDALLRQRLQDQTEVTGAQRDSLLWGRAFPSYFETAAGTAKDDPLFRRRMRELLRSLAGGQNLLDQLLKEENR